MSIVGLMGKSIITFFILAFVIISGVVMQADEEFKPESFEKILDNSYGNVSKNFQVTEENSIPQNIINKVVDTAIYVGMEGAKMGTNIAYKNKEKINFKFVSWLILLALLSCFIVPVTKFSVICFILSKEYLQKRREKKELLEIKNRGRTI